MANVLEEILHGIGAVGKGIGAAAKGAMQLNPRYQAYEMLKQRMAQDTQAQQNWEREFGLHQQQEQDINQYYKDTTAREASEAARRASRDQLADQLQVAQANASGLIHPADVGPSIGGVRAPDMTPSDPRDAGRDPLNLGGQSFYMSSPDQISDARSRDALATARANANAQRQIKRDQLNEFSKTPEGAAFIKANPDEWNRAFAQNELGLNIPEAKTMSGEDEVLSGALKGDPKAIHVLQLMHPHNPPSAGANSLFVPSADGGYDVIAAPGPGGHIPGNAMTKTGVNTMSVPTAQSRNMGQMAAGVIPQAQRVIGEVQALKSKLGPAAGRWNETYVNKLGANDPDFAGLDQDLDLLSSAIVRTHFGARGGQAYQAQMKKNFTEAQSPEDLQARIEHADTWLRGYAQGGGVKIPDSPNAPSGITPYTPPQTATGPNGHKIKSTDGGNSWVDAVTGAPIQ